MKNLEEQILKINKLLGNDKRPKIFDYLVEGDLSDFSQNKSLNEDETQQQQGESDKIGFFWFGPKEKGQKIFYVKSTSSGKFTPYYLPNNSFDPATLLSITGSELQKDNWGYYQSIIRNDIVESSVVGVKTNKGTYSKGADVPIEAFRRYFPTYNWSATNFLYVNKIPYGFKTVDGKYFTLSMKLLNPSMSAAPWSNPNDTSRGWILTSPGMQATTSNYDVGTGYYEIGTQMSYNMVAPRIESDYSSWDGDVRSKFDKFADSGWMILSQAVAAIGAYLLTRGLVNRFAFTRLGQTWYANNAIRYRLAYVVAATTAEASLNVPLSMYYFIRGEEYEEMGWITLAFTLLPVLSAYNPTIQRIIGTEYSTTTILQQMASNIERQVANFTPKTAAEFYSKIFINLGPEEKLIWTLFAEGLAQNPQAFKQALEDFLEKTMPTRIGDGSDYLMGLNNIGRYIELVNVELNAKQLGTATSIFAGLISGILLTRFTSKLYETLGLNSTEILNPEAEAEKAKQALGKFESTLDEYEKYLLTKKEEFIKNFHLTVQANYKSTDQKKLFDEIFKRGLFPDSLKLLVEKATKEQAIKDISTGVSGDYAILAQDYVAGKFCWETDILNSKDISKITIDRLIRQFTIRKRLTNNKEKCKQSNSGNAEPKCIPCWAKIDILTPDEIIPSDYYTTTTTTLNTTTTTTTTSDLTTTTTTTNYNQPTSVITTTTTVIYDWEIEFL